jgi:hypothetical protein
MTIQGLPHSINFPRRTNKSLRRLIVWITCPIDQNIRHFRGSQLPTKKFIAAELDLCEADSVESAIQLRIRGAVLIGQFAISCIERLASEAPRRIDLDNSEVRRRRRRGWIRTGPRIQKGGEFPRRIDRSDQMRSAANNIVAIVKSRRGRGAGADLLASVDRTWNSRGCPKVLMTFLRGVDSDDECRCSSLGSGIEEGHQKGTNGGQYFVVPWMPHLSD